MSHLENMEDDIKSDEGDKLPNWKFCLFWITVIILFILGLIWFIKWLIRLITNA